MTQTTTEFRDEFHRSVAKIEKVAETTESTASTIREIQITVNGSKSELAKLRSEVMEVETKTADEIKAELGIRKTKIEHIRTHTDSLVSVVNAVKVSMDEITSDVQSVKALVCKENVQVVLQDLVRDVKLAGLSLKVIEEQSKQGTTQVSAVEGDIGTVKADMECVKGEVGALKGDLCRVQSDVALVTEDVGELLF